MKEQKLMGANITGFEGGSLFCLDLKNNRHYTIHEVDSQGAITRDDENRFNRLSVEDLKDNGIEIIDFETGSPRLHPGEKEVVIIGKSKALIEGTSGEGVLFNGIKPPKYTEEIEERLYPTITRNHGLERRKYE